MHSKKLLYIMFIKVYRFTFRCIQRNNFILMFIKVMSSYLDNFKITMETKSCISSYLINMITLSRMTVTKMQVGRKVLQEFGKLDSEKSGIIFSLYIFSVDNL